MMVLPPIETTSLLLIHFAPKTSLRLIELVELRLCSGGLIKLGNTYTTREAQQRDGRIVLRLTTSQQVLEDVAEHIHLMKQQLIHKL